MQRPADIHVQAHGCFVPSWGLISAVHSGIPSTHKLNIIMSFIVFASMCLICMCMYLHEFEIANYSMHSIYCAIGHACVGPYMHTCIANMSFYG